MRIDQAIKYTPARIEAERVKLALLRSHTGTVHLADAGRPEDTFCGQRRDSLEEIGSPELSMAMRKSPLVAS